VGAGIGLEHILRVNSASALVFCESASRSGRFAVTRVMPYWLCVNHTEIISFEGESYRNREAERVQSGSKSKSGDHATVALLDVGQISRFTLAATGLTKTSSPT
jgi:hypothetical protein